MFPVANSVVTVHKKCKVVVCLFLLCLLPCVSGLEAISEIDDPTVQACLQRSLPKSALTQTVLLNTFDESGLVAELSAEIFWKRFDADLSRALIRLIGPPHKVGLALLVAETEDRDREPEMHTYLPELRTTRRIVGSALAGSMFGTGFSYEDFAQMQGVMQDRTVRRLADETLGGRDVYTIETTPNAVESQYRRIVTFVDQQWCVPVATHFYQAGESPVKEIIVDQKDVREIQGYWIPYRLTMHDRLKNGRTEVTVEKAAVNPKLRDGVFTTSGLSKGH